MSQSLRSPREKFTEQEDALLVKLVESSEIRNWVKIAEQMNGRTARQCRERYDGYLAPHVIKRDWTEEEDKLLLQKYAELGSKWATIATFFLGRTNTNVKNRYNLLCRNASKKAKDKMPVEEEKKVNVAIVNNDPLGVFESPTFDHSNSYLESLDSFFDEYGIISWFC